MSTEGNWYQYHTTMVRQPIWHRVKLAVQILSGWNFTIRLSIYSEGDSVLIDDPELVLEKEER